MNSVKWFTTSRDKSAVHKDDLLLAYYFLKEETIYPESSIAVPSSSQT